MEAIVIGHGPGLKGVGRGPEIDGFETVVKLGDGFYWQKPEDYGMRINLVGFDNVWAGNQDNYNDWNAIRRGEQPRKSGHDLRVERLLLDELMEHYNVEIAPL